METKIGSRYIGCLYFNQEMKEKEEKKKKRKYVWLVIIKEFIGQLFALFQVRSREMHNGQLCAICRISNLRVQ